ncbi:uncharacterized serine-rich protein C215.13-like [Mangifera indica]|uniref:uncharacterized serine-rich protein C215.13-like n=1 Tax=Mangifera indica TaxID=29780 RepID=UPI001CFB0F1D|nr:uncharacterized serine-rich protein C215.13-like [Mangifera indica]
MEGIKVVGIGGGGKVGVEDDMGDGMQCSDHPYRNNPGGICAFCLQEKLGKLVSSSFPLPVRGSSSSSSSPSFRSDIGGVTGVAINGGVTATSSSLSLSVRPTAASKSSRNDKANDRHYNQEYYTRRARIPFLLAKKKKKITVASSDREADIVFKRSKSTATPRRGGHFLDGTTIGDGEDFSPRKRSGFWSFFYHSSSSSSSSRSNTTKKMDKVTAITSNTINGSHVKSKERCLGSSLSRKSDIVVIEEDDSPNSQASASASSFERKVSRSRSVGCGSRSFSGDLFERISTGFGDCTLRRVESQREGKQKQVNAPSSHMKEKVKCGGIFGGFIMTSSSSSSSSSSYWVSSSAEDHVNGKSTVGAGPLVHGRSKSWGWAFASPMRAFTKPSKDGKKDHIIREAANKSTTPNLSAIPSLLSVRG